MVNTNYVNKRRVRPFSLTLYYHRLARTGVALPGFDQLKDNSKPKDKSPIPKPKPRQVTPPGLVIRHFTSDGMLEVSIVSFEHMCVLVYVSFQI